MSRPTRRRMLRDSTIAAAMLTAGFPNRFDMGSRPAFAGEPAAAGKDRLNVMVCGVAGRGWALANAFAQHPSCRVTFICDVDEAIGRNRVDEFERRYGYRPAFIRDLRHGCDDKNLDVVVVATPNHWHALAAIWAMQAGKDVYLEKPVSHTIWEGRQLIAAARQHQRICQTGTQSRSLDGAIAAVDYVQSGKIGDVRLARGLCYKRRKSIGSKGIVAFVGSGRKVGCGDVLGPSRQFIRFGNPDAALRGTNLGNGPTFPPLLSAIRQPATFIA